MAPSSWEAPVLWLEHAKHALRAKIAATRHGVLFAMLLRSTAMSSITLKVPRLLAWLVARWSVRPLGADQDRPPIPQGTGSSELVPSRNPAEAAFFLAMR
jgi:hypothetical protein